MPDATKFSVESDERGFELWIELDEDIESRDGRLCINVQAIAEEVYDSVKGSIGPWLQERDDALREYRTGIADDPSQQEVLDRIKHGPMEKPDLDGYSGFAR